MVPGEMEGGGGWCQHPGLGRGQFAETPLSIRVPRRWGLVSKPQELWQIPPRLVLVLEGGAGGH